MKSNSSLRKAIYVIAVAGAMMFTACSKDDGPIEVQSIEIEGAAGGKLALSVGETHQLTANVEPADAVGKNVTWKSSNTTVATVSSKGLITTYAQGTATITATVKNGKTASIELTVTAIDVASITLDKTTIELLVDATEQLTATLSPDNATDKTVTWTSSAETVAKVSSSGVVSGVAAGEATITATTGNGKTATCEVKVSNINQDFTINGVTFTMVPVDGGTFMMGGDSALVGDKKSLPIHQVTLTDYMIGKYEVTQELWMAVMGTNPSNSMGEKKPVELVTWYDVAGADSTSTIGYTLNRFRYFQDGFIYKLSDLYDDGKSNNSVSDASDAKYKFYLPTEAQWEFAALGGKLSKGYIFSGSNTADEVAWVDYNSRGVTHEVGTKNGNELGIYDMSGNVWEMVGDRIGIYSSEAQIDPVSSSDLPMTVIRGGSYYSEEIALAFRMSIPLIYSGISVKSLDLGFRLALKP